VASFARYQAEDAESWEHMALTRARVVGHCPEAEAAIAETLHRARDPETLRRAVLAMRADIAAAKPAKGAFDVKLAPGGLVDLEFLVHFLQLRDGIGVGPDLGAAISSLTAAGRLPDGLAEAHDMLTRFLVLLRLVAASSAVPAGFTQAVEAMLARGMGAASFPAVVEQLALAKTAVRLAFQDILATKGT
jgi:glutamate-ammonia-ligase adenylyltransferase